MDRLQAPAVLDQLRGEEVQQLGVRRRLALASEIIGCGDDAPAEMMLPESIDHDTGEKMARTLLGVGDPLSQGNARFGNRRFLGVLGRLHPLLVLLGGIHQDLDEAGR